KTVADELISSPAHKVTRGYLGIYITDLNPMAARTFGFNGKGVLVEDPIEGGPAAKADIHRGDIITKIDGHQVETADDLRNLVASYAPGKTFPVELYRDNKPMTVNVTVQAMPDQL